MFEVGIKVQYFTGGMKGIVIETKDDPDDPIGTLGLVEWEDGHKSWKSSDVLIPAK